MYVEYSTFIEIIALAVIFGFSAGVAFIAILDKNSN